ncbi:NADH-flavin reductase [Actinoplanes lobatus]|uniref:NADH-flavin reductase n=1 Tax=Actinoplanes lobatus TaxID=113568 RepID=A0A7W7HMF2_9ACTN|nr:NAD(P)-binding oxidoreductase [Actinoplanes lobatus]MBB4753160.1 putative NADH-flavin reductase [Actinoplanes lobatus]GGN58936.1 NADH-flavin reductase [Actinoplanes lobatus]GIE42979.1 NADH-flavin reductase [Actinoplanes lobatus]
MRLFVFGASGSTGAELIAQALDAGHRVTALARTPDSIPRRAGLTVLRGNVLDPDGWRTSLAGHDAVLSCLGSADRRPTTVYSQGVTGIIAAMHDHAVRRLSCISSIGLGEFNLAPLSRRLLMGYLVQPLYRHMFADMKEMEHLVAASELDWTIVRPPRLTNGALTGRYRTAVNEDLPNSQSLARADLAHYLLHHLDDPAGRRAIVHIAN